MSSPAPVPAVVALLCRACHNPLPSASNDIAFRCARCGRAWELSEAELEPRPSSYVNPPAHPQGTLLYLPYWAFQVQARAVPKQPDEASLTARDRAAGFERAFVAAYAVHRPTYLGEWGQTYTRQRPEWEVRTGSGPAAIGAAISSKDARVIARQYVLAEIDQATDLAKLDVMVRVAKPALWAIPCADLGDRLRCPWTRAELPALALDDLSQIRGDGERKEA